MARHPRAAAAALALLGAYGGVAGTDLDENHVASTTPAPLPARWDCGSNGICVQATTGHKSKSACEQSCSSPTPGMHYTCGGLGECFQKASATTNLSQCEAACAAPPMTPRPPAPPTTPRPPEPPHPPTPAGVVPTIEIAPGVNMPQMNLGTCCGSWPKIGLESWMANGGFGIDTANDYGHALTDIAKRIKDVPREKLFLTTKVSVHATSALDVVKSDIQQLGVTYLDLVLLHAPGTTAHNQKLWAELEQAVAQNLTRAIGVSNYGRSKLRELQKTAKMKVALNQCNMSVMSHSDQTIKYCQDNNITYEAYGGLKGCRTSDPTLRKVAAAHNKSVQQVCLRYIIDRGCIMAVGTGKNASTVDKYAKADLRTFDFKLSKEEITELGKL